MSNNSMISMAGIAGLYNPNLPFGGIGAMNKDYLASLRLSKTQTSTPAAKAHATGLEDLLASVNAAGLIGDSTLAMTVITDQIRTRNEEVQEKIQAIRNASAAAKKLGARIDQLRQISEALKRMNNDDGQENASHAQRLSKLATELKMPLEDLVNVLRVRKFNCDPKTGEVNVEWTDELLGNVGDYTPGHTREMVSPADIDARIKELEGQQQQFSEQNQQLAIGLQDSMSKKANLIEMLSNMMKKKSDSQGSIISNMR